MEWIKLISLRKSLFLIIATSTTVGLMLFFSMTSICMCHSPISFRVLVRLVLPFAIAVGVPVFVAAIFYNVKLKVPLAQLSMGAKLIKENDLDFSINFSSKDELGQLCESFESMRVELLKSNKELWQQMEERKRLNAAFAHDLRNPVTVLKGSAAILQKNLELGTLTTENAEESISLITQYSIRIESYIQAMTSVQKLEELSFTPKAVDWFTLANELKSGLTIIASSSEKKVDFLSSKENIQLNVDSFMIHNVAENLVSNALRHSKDNIVVNMTCDNEKITISVSDDGSGFSAAILKKGAAPFLRDTDEPERQNFGMGLYICNLLCEKHSGNLTLENHFDGAKVTAKFYF